MIGSLLPHIGIEQCSISVQQRAQKLCASHGYLLQKSSDTSCPVLKLLYVKGNSFRRGQNKASFWQKNKQSDRKKLEIRRDDIKIKQHKSVTYLGCTLDENLSGESMATRILGKINGRLRFLYRKQYFLDFSFRRLLANALIQPYFDYASSAWFAIIR